MPKRSLPSERIASEIREMVLKGFSGISEMMVKSAQLFVQKTLEAEGEDFLGLKWAERSSGGRVGYRNGYEPYQVSTAEGAFTVEKPQFRDGVKGFESKLLPVLKRRSDSLELLTVQMWIRGMSQADISETFKRHFGISNMSESVVQGLCRGLESSYKEFCVQDLSSHDVLYLFLDGIYLPLRKKKRSKEAVLSAIGITRAGRKVLLGLSSGPRESYECWKDFLRDLVSRGLEMPLLAVRDKNPGLMKALNEIFPYTAQQTCLAHKTRNLVNKMPSELSGELRSRLDAALYAKDYKTALELCKGIIRDFRGKAEAFLHCFEPDLNEMLAYLKFPQNHWKQIRTTNVIERRFEEVKRRTKVIPGFQNESSGLLLTHAVLIEYMKKKPWRGVKTSEDDYKKLDAIRHALFVEKKELRKVA